MKRIMTVFVMLLIVATIVSAKKAVQTAQEPNATMLQKKAAINASLPLEKTIELGNEVNMAVVFIPAGEFDMGSPPEEIKRDSDEA
jgi:formylglycine-generating enzyme required for sulfatase activity